jgi:hypothetical protein
MNNFISKHYLVISSLISALILLVQGWTTDAGISSKTMLFSAMTITASIVGKYLSGKGLSVAGVLGGAGVAFALVAEDGVFSWKEFASAATLQILLVLSSGIAKYQPKATAIVVAALMLFATACSPYKKVQRDVNRSEKELAILAQVFQQTFPMQAINSDTSIVSYQLERDEAIAKLISEYDAYIAQLKTEQNFFEAPVISYNNKDADNPVDVRSDRDHLAADVKGIKAVKKKTGMLRLLRSRPFSSGSKVFCLQLSPTPFELRRV